MVQIFPYLRFKLPLSVVNTEHKRTVHDQSDGAPV